MPLSPRVTGATKAGFFKCGSEVIEAISRTAAADWPSMVNLSRRNDRLVRNVSSQKIGQDAQNPQRGGTSLARGGELAQSRRA